MNWQTLTHKEKRIAYLLAEVEHDSVWGMAIAKYNQNRTNDRFKQLIIELSSQALDDPGTMSKIIGWELVDLLLNYDHHQYCRCTP